MTRNTRVGREEKADLKATARDEKLRSRRVPSRFDILIQCRDEAEQRELFERLTRDGLRLKLLIL